MHFYVYPDKGITFTEFQKVANIVIYNDNSHNIELHKSLQKYFKFRLQHRIAELWFNKFKEKQDKKRKSLKERKVVKRRKK